MRGKNLQCVLLMMVLGATAALAQTPPAAPPPIVHQSPSCFRPERKALVEARLNVTGTPRVFFRQHGAEDWCYVDGERILDEAMVILPEFRKGITVDYFFVTYVEDRITGRSPTVYQAVISDDCSTPVARHGGVLSLECAGGNAIAAGMGGNYTSQSVQVSPSNPDQK